MEADMSQGFGGFLRRLVGGGKGEAGAEPQREEPVEYSGYTIHAAPRNEGSHWIVAGTISKAGDEGTREYHFVRADSYASRDAAVEFTVIKAKQMIDLEGDRIFEKDRSRH
jgi:hypothetical protein